MVCHTGRFDPAAAGTLETGQLSRHYIAEISVTKMLNHNQPTAVAGKQ